MTWDTLPAKKCQSEVMFSDRGGHCWWSMKFLSDFRSHLASLSNYLRKAINISLACLFAAADSQALVRAWRAPTLRSIFIHLPVERSDGELVLCVHPQGSHCDLVAVPLLRPPADNLRVTTRSPGVIRGSPGGHQRTLVGPSPLTLSYKHILPKGNWGKE